MTIQIAPQALAAKIHKIIDTYPAMHDQSMWGVQRGEEGTITSLKDASNECGTTMCVAGWAAFLTGNANFPNPEENKDSDKDYYGEDYYGNLTLTEEANAKYGYSDVFTRLGKDLLGLTYDDANHMFYGARDEIAKAALRQLAQGKEIDWDDAEIEGRAARERANQ